MIVFLAKNIPIYWGATNISEIVSKEYFIDFRDFDSYEELYLFIKNMEDDVYLGYINAINKLLNSESICRYTLENWVKGIKNAIFKLEKKNV